MKSLKQLIVGIIGIAVWFFIFSRLSTFGSVVYIIFTLIFLATWSDYNDREARGQPHPWE